MKNTKTSKGIVIETGTEIRIEHADDTHARYEVPSEVVDRIVHEARAWYGTFITRKARSRRRATARHLRVALTFHAEKLSNSGESIETDTKIHALDAHENAGVGGEHQLSSSTPRSGEARQRCHPSASEDLDLSEESLRHAAAA